MLPGQVPDLLTPCTVSDLRDAIERAWIVKFDATPRRESLLVLLAQWAEETGWGRYCHCWNLGNAKHVEGDGRAWCAFRCSEIIDGREVWFDPPDPATRFRAFESLDAGAADYLELLWHHFGRSWGAVLAGDPAAFARALKAQGYYTAPEPKYEAALVALYQQVDGMLSADAEPAQGWTWRQVQQALNDAAPAPHLVVDGIVGPRTRGALLAFQERLGLAMTSLADEATVQALRAGANA
jgi:hypothetical protein